MTQPGAHVIPKLSLYTQVQNKSKTVSEALLQNVHRLFSIKPNPNNCELYTMARHLIRIGKMVVSFLRYSNNYFYT